MNSLNWSRNKKIRKAKNDIIRSILANNSVEFDLNTRNGTLYVNRILEEAISSYYSLHFTDKILFETISTQEKCIKLLQFFRDSVDSRVLNSIPVITGDKRSADRLFKVPDYDKKNVFGSELFYCLNERMDYEFKPTHFLNIGKFENLSIDDFNNAISFLNDNPSYWKEEILSFQTDFFSIYNNSDNDKIIAKVIDTLDSHNINYDYLNIELISGTHSLMYKGYILKDVILKIIDDHVQELLSTCYKPFKFDDYFCVKSFSSFFSRFLFLRAQNVQSKLIRTLCEHSDIEYFQIQWKSEYNLFKIIKDEFKDTSILLHHSPRWLSPQHLDIYIPEHKIGVEYNGKQHYEPIEHFGGESNFKKTVKRDKKKAKVCRQNNVKLITHKYDDSIRATINEIKKSIK